jgi:hypothetical protein
MPGGATGGASTGGAAAGGEGGSSTAAGGVPAIEDLSALQSFRWNIEMSGAGAFLGSAGVPSIPGSDGNSFTASGAYIAPDQAQVQLSTGGFQFKQTIKGNQEWTSVAGMTTGPVPTTSRASDLIYVSSFVDPASVVDESSMNCGATENVNGVSAVRCETTQQANEMIVSSLGGADAVATDASYVIWVAEQGNFIVRWELNASGTAQGAPFEWKFTANITDVNNVGSIDP